MKKYKAVKIVSFLMSFCMLCSCMFGCSFIELYNSSSGDSTNSESSLPESSEPPQEEPPEEKPPYVPTPIDIADCVSIDDGATLTVNSRGTGSVEHNGLLISPTTATTEYSGRFNGVFQGNLDLIYSFPGTCEEYTTGKYDMPQGNFIFRITDANNKDNWFEFEHYVLMNNSITGGGLMGIVVRDSLGNVRVTHETGGTIFTGKAGNNAGAAYGRFGQDNAYSSGMHLNWNRNGVLTVLARDSRREVTDTQLPRLVSKFDGSLSVDADNGKYGVPKMTFPNGYLVSFVSKNYEGNVLPIRFENVAGESWATERLTDTPSWNKDYQNYIEISLEEDYDSVYAVGETIPVYGATYISPSKQDETGKAVAKVEMKRITEPSYREVTTESITLTETGYYTIRYTAIEGGEQIGNVYEKTIQIVNSVFETKNIVTMTSGNATITPQSLGNGSIYHKGLLVSPSAKNVEYAGTINGEFSATSATSFVYSFPGASRVSGEFAFIIADAENPTNCFEIVYKHAGACMNVSIKYGEKIRSTKYYADETAEDGTKHYQIFDTNGGAYTNAGQFGQDNQSSSGFKLEWDASGVLHVYSNSTSTQGAYVLVAKFDGTPAIDSLTDSYGLDKITFTNGYTVSFESRINSSNVVPVRFESIAGTSLETNKLNEIPAWYKEKIEK